MLQVFKALTSKQIPIWVHPTKFVGKEVKNPFLHQKPAPFFAFAVGRYKAATSLVFLRPVKGTGGKIVVKQFVSSKRQRKVVQPFPVIKSRPKVTSTTIERYFQFDQEHINQVKSPLKFFQTKYDVFVKVSGGGKKGQSRAIKLAISRAIIVYYQEIDKRRGRVQERSEGKAVKYRRHLKNLGYLTQDSRSKERKKIWTP